MEIINIILINIHYIIVIGIFIILRKYLKQALLGEDNKLCFKELVKATVWFSFLILMLKYVSTNDTSDININLILTLLGYMLFVGGFDILSKKINNNQNEKEISKNQ